MQLKLGIAYMIYIQVVTVLFWIEPNMGLTWT